jgi:hypothetical protein
MAVQHRDMAKFYRSVAISALREFWTATDNVLASVAVLSFFLILFNRTLGEKIMTAWNGLSPWWSLIPIGMLVIYRLLRANYQKFAALEERLAKIERAVTPLQIEGFQLAAEIREFARSFGKLEGPPPEADAKLRKAVWEHLQEWIGSYPPELDVQIRAKMLHGFEARRFRGRVEEYMHKVGECGYPIINASGFTESIFDRRSLCRLSADIEIVAISSGHFPPRRKAQDYEQG